MAIEDLKKVKDGNERNFYMNFNLKHGLEVEFTAYEGEMLTEGELTSFALYDACRSFALQ